MRDTVAAVIEDARNDDHYWVRAAADEAFAKTGLGG